jgi:hypothetical protein
VLVSFDSDDLGNPAYGYENATGTGTTGAFVEGFDAMAAACQDVWMGGARDETLTLAAGR